MKPELETGSSENSPAEEHVEEEVLPEASPIPPKRPSPEEKPITKKQRLTGVTVCSKQSKAPHLPSDTTIPVTPLPRYSMNTPHRSSSVPVSSLDYRNQKSSETLTSIRPATKVNRQLPSPPQELIYQDPDRRATIWLNSSKRSPFEPRTLHTKDDDDQLMHSQILQGSGPRSNRIRVSMGDISIEIESGSSPAPANTPRQRLVPVSGKGANSIANGKRKTSREIPSTPGSSPLQRKTDAIEGNKKLIKFGKGTLNGHVDVDNASTADEPTVLGAETQAMFTDDEEYTVPGLEIPDSPYKFQPSTSRSATTKFLENTDEWVSKKAKRYHLDSAVIWWMLERTSGHPNLAIKALKAFKETERTSRQCIAS